MIATSPLATWLIFGLVFGTTAALFWFGIRAPIQPPDPDWREHQRIPVRPPRSYWILWGIGNGLLFGMALLTSMTGQRWLAFVAFAGWVTTSVARFVIAYRHERAAREAR